MKTRKNQLTARQQQFCQLYAGPAQHNAALAARMAGYASASSHVTGCQLLQKPKIAATVRVLEDLTAKELMVTRQRVINKLQEAAAMARLKAEPMAMIAAWKAIAQASGLDRPEKALVVASTDTGQANLLGEFSAMSDQQLMAFIAQGRAPMGSHNRT